MKYLGFSNFCIYRNKEQENKYWTFFNDHIEQIHTGIFFVKMNMYLFCLFSQLHGYKPDCSDSNNKSKGRTGKDVSRF